MTHIAPTESSAAALIARGMDSPATMLNLLKFRDIADYSHAPDLAPARPISGAAAYGIYEAAIAPLLKASGGEVLFAGEGGAWFIGPEAERWDRVLLVRQTSIASFLAFAQDSRAQAAGHHRTAALEDSRLLPLTAA
ncbi:hypothetical protein [Sinisalibacter aestuarii]|uniref:DUF1330 domain-containing protein n=1 Tax=Sinisalibacter aestuarii TaxID=2949426 RepID=A0ABQ5LVP8_9RHOB|nr:hypothetical protein [Sinisalibacter aestuarii]GKY89070.1 hypothetical protein STA1M1_29390 [Sinisalibacter aestuarii]